MSRAQLRQFLNTLVEPESLALDPHWERDFDEGRLNGGRELARRGRVLDMQVTDGGYRLTARVAAENGATHEVAVRFQIQIAAGTRVVGKCSCGESNCQHTAASLFAGLNKHGTMFRPVLQRKPAIKPCAAPAMVSADDEGKPVLAMHYVLSPKRLDLGLEVKFYAADQAESIPRIFDPATWRRQFRSHRLDEEDASLVAGICGSRVAFYDPVYDLVHERGSELFQRLLQRGRAQWNNEEAPFLSEAGARAVTVEWRMDERGAQRPALLADGLGEVRLVDLCGAWYVHTPSGKCGWAKSAAPIEILLKWQRLRPVQPGRVARFREQYRDFDVALPALPPMRTIEGVRPVPCLSFFSEETRLPDKRGRDQRVRFDGCRVHWDYGGFSVPWDEAGEVAQQWTGSELVQTRRDWSAETEWVGRINDAGLWAMDETDADYRADILTLDKRDPISWSRLVLNDLPALAVEGCQVDCQPSFRYRFAEVEDWYTDAVEKKDWFTLELGVMVDGVRVNLLAPLVETIRQCPDWFVPGSAARLPDDQVIPVALPDGRMAAIPFGRLRPALEVLVELYSPRSWAPDGEWRVSRLRAAELAGIDAGGFQWVGSSELKALGTRLQAFAGLNDVPCPVGLSAELREYQRQGLNWLQFLREHDLGGVLADDMGLGKTLQALAHLLIEREAGRADLPSLVVAPTSLVSNWKSEAERFTPSLRVMTFHGASRHERLDEMAEHDLVITTYPLLMRDIEALEKTKFHFVILDEAQVVKNARARTSEAVRRLRSRHRLCLTGTPMENHLGELWALFDFLLPGFLGDGKQFREIFRVPIEKLGSTTRREMLARRIAPFLLRRTKENVTRELPPKTEIVRLVEIAGAQRDLYESIRVAMHERVRAEVKAHGLERSHILVLDALLKLRQVCCDPRLVKIAAARRVEESAKLELLLELLPEMIEEGRRVLLFSQFTSMLALIEPELTKRRIRFAKLIGSTRDRPAQIAQFQNGDVPLFLISLKAGGTGLNLTAADTVIHYDPWWNPAVENQATDRAHRIGQEKPVFVYKLITAGSVEEKIAALQRRKKELVDQLLGESARGKLALSAADLESLFEPLPAA